MQKSSNHAHMMLFFTTLLWGATFPIVRNFGGSGNPIIFVLLRFVLATLVMLPFVYKKLKLTDIWILKYGMLLGGVNSCIFLFQTIALQTLDSPRAAFLASIYVILVPFLLPLFGFRKPRIGEVIAALICLYGVYILSGARIAALHIGDLWIIASTLCMALSLIIIEHVGNKIQDVLLFSFYQIIFTAVLPLIILVVHPVTIPITANFWWSLIYCAIFATTLAFVLQVKYQPVVGASKTALIFSIEAVFASGCAWLMGEKINRQTLIGGGIILLSVVLIDVMRILHEQARDSRLMNKVRRRKKRY